MAELMQKDKRDIDERIMARAPVHRWRPVIPKLHVFEVESFDASKEVEQVHQAAPERSYRSLVSGNVGG